MHRNPTLQLVKSFNEASIEEILGFCPPLKIAYETTKKQKEKFKEACLAKLLVDIKKDVADVKDKVNTNFFNTTEGIEYCIKIITIATNGEHADKIEYFAHALVNSVHNQKDVLSEVKSKFIDILKNLSYIDLKVLAEIKKWATPDAMRQGYKEVELGLIIPLMGKEYTARIVETSFINLVNNGVLSKISSWHPENTTRGELYSTGYAVGDYDRAIYTDFTISFVNFISKPV